MDVMQPLDSAFLRLEGRNTSLNIASVAIFEGPAPSYQQMADLLRRKLDNLPRYRQKIREVPLWLGRPVWVDAPDLDLSQHLRHTALPSPGGPAELRALMGRVMSQQLERSRPLWEDWLVEGLEGGRWALISKVHHCMVDGIAGTDLLTRVLDTRPDAPALPLPAGPPPADDPGTLRLLASALTTVPHRPLAAARSVTELARNPRRTADDALLLGRGLLSWARLAVPAEPSSLTGPLGRARSWDYTSTTFADLKRIRAAHGGTINDIVLTAITRGFRDLLLWRGERPAEHAVRTLVPVSVRKPAAAGTSDNEVSAMIADLPVGESTALDRLAAVKVELGRLKRSGEIQVGELLTEAGGWTSPLVLAIGLTGAFRLPHRHLVTVATNVPGPRQPLYALGRRLLEMYPFVPIADRVRLGVAMTSYDGRMTFGVTADAASTPDLSVLTEGIAAGMQELVALSPAGKAEPAARPRRRAG